MPTNPNQNEKAKDTEDSIPALEPGAPNTSSSGAAYVRTFRGDVKKKRGIDDPGAAMNPQQFNKEPSSAASSNPVRPKQKNDAVVHTFKDDVQHLVRNKKMSLTRIAALESDRRDREGASPEAVEPKKTGIVVGLVVLFLVIAGVFGLGAYYLYQGQQTASTQQQLDPALIFVEARQRVDVSGMSARQIIDALTTVRRNTFSALGSVVELYILDSPEDAAGETNDAHLLSAAFLNGIKARVPQTFTQTLSNEYMLGIHVIDENVPFLILKTQSYGHAFSGMLAWEPYIESDLLPFFSPDTEFVRPAAAEGANAFIDDVIENLDVRVLKDAEGNVRIIYAFVDRSTIVLTTDVRTLTELAQRIRVQ